MGGSFSPGWGENRDILRNKGEVKSVCAWEKREKEPEESVTMSHAQMQRRERTCEQEREVCPGQKAWRVRLFQKQHLPSKKQAHCAKSVSESLQITSTGSVLGSRFCFESADVRNLQCNTDLHRLSIIPISVMYWIGKKRGRSPMRRAVVLKPGVILPVPGDIWQCLGIVFVVTTVGGWGEGRCYWCLVGRGWGCC